MFRWLFLTLLGGAALAVLLVYAVYRYLEPQLPDIEVLRDVRYQMPMSVYSRGGKLIAQFGEKKRSPVNIADIPKPVINAFLAAEDDRFFDHPGVDYQGLVRATFTFLRTGEKRQGGSTITMQVARNFFLSSEKTFFRKIKEILLAIKIESKLPKQQILELYLNKIYFGHHAYGVEAASQVYYGKPLSELSLGEVAMIAGLPKAPSAFNPITNPERALTRRDYVLKRMLKLDFVDDREFDTAIKEPVTASLHAYAIEMNAPHIAEMVRAEMYEQYGEDAYVNGYKVYTTIDERLQGTAENALRRALHEYDERHGYRGVKRRVDLKKFRAETDWDEQLAPLAKRGDTLPGLVVAVRDQGATVYLPGTGRVELGWEGMKWARKFISEDAQGPAPRTTKEIVKPGDIVRLRAEGGGGWALTQDPQVEGALVALDPGNGAISALMGGFDFGDSKFNRATQAQRQPGSGFKPILYAAALDKGYTPASVINDAPFVYYDPAMEGGAWRPQNYSGRFYGPTRLRVALVKSRNLVSIRLLKEIGVKKAIEVAKQFGFADSELPHSLSLALGSGTASPLRMAQAYSVFANGGFHIEPYLIERIQRQDGETLFQATPYTACSECESTGRKAANGARRAITPQVHYMMHSMLQDVIREGTATKALQLGRSDLAGKTGTTNEERDAWFNGYSPSLVTVTWLGFDSFKPLGEGETGGHTALPMWMYFMEEALKGVPERSFPVPEGITTARIDPASGLLTSSGGIYEIFPADKTPKYYSGPASSSADGARIEPALSDPESAPLAPPATPGSGRPAGSKAMESLF